MKLNATFLLMIGVVLVGANAFVLSPILPEVADPTEFFTDLIDVEPPPNCIVLDHRWFNLTDLLPSLDLVSIWHGTATLEVLARGVPVVVAATWGSRDHPIEVIVPRDRDDYRAILTERALAAVDDEQRRRAKLLIAHLVDEEVMVPYPYGNLFALRGASAHRWGWRMDRVEHYLAHGDPHVAHLADLAEFGRPRAETDGR